MANNTIRGKATIVTTTQSETLGITAPVPMGEWQASTPYLKLNLVRHNGASYIAKKQSTGVEPTVTTGWQEVWQLVNADGNGVVTTTIDYQANISGTIPPTGEWVSTIPDVPQGQYLWTRMVFSFSDGSSATSYLVSLQGLNFTQEDRDSIERITDAIPSSASEDNPLATKDFVNSSINAMAAFYITYNIEGNAFPTKSDLSDATTFYSGGETRVPTQNDYAIVLSDESRAQSADGSYPTTRYSYQGGTYPDGQWDFQYVVNNTSLTQAQVDAINSGITKELVETIGKGNVLSVNGETGAVTITPESIGAVDKAGDTMTGNLMISKDEYWGRYSSSATNSYRYRVAPLVDLTHDTANVERFFSGTVDIIRTNGLSDSMFSATIACQKYYASSAYELTVFYHKKANNSGLCTFTKNGRLYLGCYYNADPNPQLWSVIGTSSGNVLQDGTFPIYEYYDSQNNVVLDSDIYNSFTTNLNYGSIAKINEFYSPNNLPQRMKITDTRNTTATDTSTFPYYTMTPFFTNKEMPTAVWYSGIDMQGWENGYLGWQLVGYAGNTLADDSPLYHRKVDKNGKTVGNWKTILEIAPTKLEPTTANGWTVGDDTLGVSSAGVYLVAINKYLLGIMVITDAVQFPTLEQFIGGMVVTSGDYSSLTKITFAQVPTYPPYWHGYSSTMTTGTMTASALTITSVAYKKLA